MTEFDPTQNRTEQEVKPLLVLDVDETLIHASTRQLHRDPDFRVGEYSVYRRPHLSEFIAACSLWYELGIWSSASDRYVEDVVQNIFPQQNRLRFVWGSSKTTQRRTLPDDYDRFGMGVGEYHSRKNLRKLQRFGWPLERTLIVDDSPEKCAQNYGNAVYIHPFEGATDDDELQFLASYLKELRTCPNFRTIEKRGWRKSVEPLTW